MNRRTPQQALQDAIDSGAVAAWLAGEPIEWAIHGRDSWQAETIRSPDFACPAFIFRPAPHKPTQIDWKPLVSGKEPRGQVLALWVGINSLPSIHAVEFVNGKWEDENDDDYCPPEYWAPMCNIPEGDK